MGRRVDNMQYTHHFKTNDVCLLDDYNAICDFSNIYPYILCECSCVRICVCMWYILAKTVLW